MDTAASTSVDDCKCESRNSYHEIPTDVGIH